MLRFGGASPTPYPGGMTQSHVGSGPGGQEDGDSGPVFGPGPALASGPDPDPSPVHDSGPDSGPDPDPDPALVRRLRAAGCVFAEEEAAILEATSAGPEQLAERVGRRVAGEPLEQVVGRVEFGSLILSVGPGVFVPRRRTLLLARLAVAIAAPLQHPVVVEAFSGVAPTAATVAHQVPQAEVHATDHDPAALAHARANLPGGLVHAGSVLEGLPSELLGRVDLIVAVPPYVPDREADFLPHEAREHEPTSALLGGADGLDPATTLVRAAPGFLCGGGALLIEVNVTQAPVLADRARGLGFEVVRVHTREDLTAVLHLRWPTGSAV